MAPMLDLLREMAAEHLDLLTRVRDHLRVDPRTCPWERADAPPYHNRVMRIIWDASMSETRDLLAEECDRLAEELEHLLAEAESQIGARTPG